MFVLVDTSVWVQHFKYSNETVALLLESDSVRTHPLVIAEIACGTPPEPRLDTLNLLRELRPSIESSYSEILHFIEANRLYGRGCGYIDFALLASCLLTKNTYLWTFDKRLLELTKRFKVAFNPSML